MDPVALCITDGQIIVRVATCKGESRKMVEAMWRMGWRGIIQSYANANAMQCAAAMMHHNTKGPRLFPRVMREGKVNARVRL